MPTEYTEVERPLIEILKSQGYKYLSAEQAAYQREGLNHVILKDTLISSLMRINGIDSETANAVYNDLLHISDNEEWTRVLRGNYSRRVPGFDKNQTIRIIDFLHPEQNTFSVSNQFRVESEKPHVADLVCCINGIPLVVIEAKSPFSGKGKSGAAFDQIKQYERDVPRLFYSNLFSIITDSRFFLVGATGAASQYWASWKDAWPKREDAFQGALDMGAYCLLEPHRLLDILAHFVVFETEDNKTVKKMCRYQQFRAVNKIVERVLENRPFGERQGLVWHTQGSGKSLTMVFAALKLKTHLTIDPSQQGQPQGIAPTHFGDDFPLASPNLLVLTDRVDLDDQISKTFVNCGIRNPERIGGVVGSVEIESEAGQINGRAELRRRIHGDLNGLTLLSTIFKFEGSKTAVPNSANWILLVDECHRTQEKDLGAYLRATFPDAHFFGFTGTPIKKTDKDTYKNFSPPDEAYLDKYGIDDAVADGATVPIKYTSRMVNWQVDPSKLDALFNNWFIEYSKEQQEAIKHKELTTAVLLKHRGRVQAVARDLWEHFKGHCLPDGYKAQLVAVDRSAVILYKWALNDIIAEDLIGEGMEPSVARAAADTYTVPVYSGSQEDGKPSEDLQLNEIRKGLVRYQLADDDTAKTKRTEKEVKADFKKKKQPPHILIVCNKLLTGFDAPAESVMYLDSPLREHGLLQAVARTNRVEESTKEYGLIVDYVGITKHLDEALASYRSEDIQNAMVDLEGLRSELRQAHAEMMRDIRGIQQQDEYLSRDAYETEFAAMLKTLGSLDVWLTLKIKIKRFLRLYGALSPDPSVLKYKTICKWAGLFLIRGTQHFEQEEDFTLKSESAKVREMLERELRVTGMIDVVKLRSITDPEFNNDFVTEGKSEAELERAAVRKAVELKKTISEKMRDNKEQFRSFAERLMDIIEKMRQKQIGSAEALKQFELWRDDLNEESSAHESLRITETAYGFYKILESLSETGGLRDTKAVYLSKGKDLLNDLQQVAVKIDAVYSETVTAPKGWDKKDELRKELRRTVKRLLHELSYQPLKEGIEKVEEFALARHGSRP